jgi:hypothetical protein
MSTLLNKKYCKQQKQEQRTVTPISASSNNDDGLTTSTSCRSDIEIDIAKQHRSMSPSMPSSTTVLNNGNFTKNDNKFDSKGTELPRVQSSGTDDIVKICMKKSVRFNDDEAMSIANDGRTAMYEDRRNSWYTVRF